MPRVLLIVNPGAQRLTAHRRRAVVERLATRADLEIQETRRRGHACELARLATRDGMDAVVVFGGDGTVNEAVNGLAGSSVPLAVIPGGGANVFARSLGLPRDPVRSAERLRHRLSGPAERLPLGRIGERWFAVNCGMGFDADVVQQVDRHRQRGGGTGEWYYVWSGVRTFLTRYDRRTPHLQVTWGEGQDGQWRGRLFLAIVQNTDPYTYLGRRPLRLCPQSSGRDGLHLFGLSTLRTGAVVPILLSAFGRANHGGHPSVTYLRDLPSLTLRSDGPMGIQADGEYLGRRDSVTITSVPDALSILR